MDFIQRIIKVKWSIYERYVDRISFIVNTVLVSDLWISITDVFHFVKRVLKV